jgi:acyl carrier protein
VVAIWRELLKLDRVGIHDNFFDLGGQSLLAIQVISRIRNSFKAEVTLQRFFDAPTIATLSEALDGEHESAVPLPPSIVPIARASYRLNTAPPDRQS